jgi:FkbM family methyltransferase
LNPRTISALRTAVFFVALAALAAGAGSFGVLVGRHFEYNMRCCQVPRYRNLALSFEEPLGLAHFYSQIGQDRWVGEVIFPGVRNGFFLDVGSGDGTIDSNTKLLEERGWTGICVDPFPTHTEGRTCQIFKEVVSNEAGTRVKFRAAGELGGVAGTLGRWKDRASDSRLVEFTTVTLGDILARAKAPAAIQFISLDIEGAELDALRGFPFDTYSFGALAVEHNDEEPKRSGILALLTAHGYQRVHSWYQDDFYVPVK